MAVHEIEVFYTVDETVVTRPDCGKARIVVGDSIQFSSPHGQLEITWLKNPFDKKVYVDGDTVKVVEATDFLGQCIIIRPDGVRLELPASGIEGKTGTGDDTDVVVATA
jgi:hypothetical protein